MNNKTNLAIAAVTVCFIVIMCIGIAQQDFSWWVFPFVLLFGTIFVSILNLCYGTFREDRFERVAKKAHPNEPWLWDERWQSDTIPAGNRTELRGSVAFSIILLMFALMGFAALWAEVPGGNPWVLLYLFPIIAAGYFIRYTYRAWQSYCFEKKLSLILDTRPAWIGSDFRARLILPAGSQLEPVKAKLEHTRVKREKESDGDISFTKSVDREVPCKVELVVGNREARITADIPLKSPETPWEKNDPSGWWDLIISMHPEGKHVELRYAVPVAAPR